jgi:hypothetical protein
MTDRLPKPDPPGATVWRRCWPVFVFQFVLLAAAAWLFRDALNPDAVAYLQLARHYAVGDMSLAISGHWSPLISWLLAILLKLGLPPLMAARVFMILSAQVFLAGCLRLFHEANISRPRCECGLWVAALLSIPWSVENITPDLMFGGIIGAAFAEMMSSRWLLDPQRALRCGLLWALGYLCKSPALPLGILTGLGMAALWWQTRLVRPHQIIRALALTMAGMTLAAVWIGVLSAHYGKLTVARSGTYNHSLVGPEVDKPVFLLDYGLTVPAAGRITIWEDPTPPYPDWSPVASWNNARRQLQVMLHNLPVVLFMLTSVSLAFPLLLAGVVGRWFRPDRVPDETKASWPLLPVFLLAVLFLPNYLLATEQRYFYCAAPLLFAAMTGRQWFDRLQRSRVFLPLLAAGFLAPTYVRAGIYLNSTRTAGECARVLAEKIAANRLAGPVVGSGKLPGGRAGLYAAWRLQQPWYGDEPAPDAADYKSIGARLMIANRGSRLARELSADPTVRDLDRELFGPEAGPVNFPLQVFENPASAHHE